LTDDVTQKVTSVIKWAFKNTGITGSHEAITTSRLAKEDDIAAKPPLLLR
jgi:hypothetical protein